MKYLLIPATMYLLTLGAALAPTIRAQPPAAQPSVNPKVLAFIKPIEVTPGDTELQKKLKERHNSAARLLDLRIKQYREGIRDVIPVYDAARLVADAKLDLATTPEARVSVLQQTLEVARLAEAYLQLLHNKGVGSPADLERARYTRLSVEVEILKAREKDRPAPK